MSCCKVVPLTLKDQYNFDLTQVIAAVIKSDGWWLAESITPVG
jgi:hypothetical protein